MLRLPLAVISALLVAVSADAATLTVNSTADNGTNTLRGAIATAASGDAIVFSLPANSTIMLTSGELLINKHLTISGPGANLLTVQRSTAGGTAQFRIFNIVPGYFNVTISGLAITNGNSANYGGGILNESSGTLTVTGCTISGNSALLGGGIDNGGILHFGFGYTGGTVNLTNSTISSNAASTGGGISNFVAFAITNSTISGNTAGNNGGGIYDEGGSSGSSGAGATTVTITNSTISGNIAGNNGGGGIFNYAFGSTGGGATVTITNSTISGNAAGSNGGGGIFNYSGGSTVAVINARNTIIAKNTAPNRPDAGGLTSQGFNLIGSDPGSIITPTTGDQIGTAGSPLDPMLGPLQSNGGPTKTQALLSGSTAIEKGNSFGSATDQRGSTRPFDNPVVPNATGGDGSDIGAFELQGPPVPAQPLNLSTRLEVQGGDNIGIGGFIITGSAPKQVLVRAVGPSLTGFGIPNALADPVLELHGPSAFATITNDNWRDTQGAAIDATGIPPSNDLESAVLMTLDPGAYTAVVRGQNDGSGVALVEVYDLDHAAGKLANISTRAFVDTGNDIVIVGFILGNGASNDTIVLRGIGPSLTAFGVPNALANPTLELHNSEGAVLASNNDWQDDSTQAAELTALGLAPTSSLESGLVVTLPPGTYTALLSGVNNGVGVGLVEVYDNPGAEPTPTPGTSATPTPTPAPTPTLTPTATPAASATPTPGGTPTQTPAGTPTPTSTPGGAVLDQQQLVYNGGLSARTLPGYKVWQSFTAEISGTLAEIDMGFFNDMSGNGQLQIFSGQGTQGTLLQTLTVPVIGVTQTPVTWNTWMLNVPVEAGQQYTFCLTPDAATLPDPYGVAIGSPDPYGGGVLGLDDPGGSHPTTFDTVFRTYVVPTPGGSPTPTATLAGTPTPIPTPGGTVLDQQQLLYNGGLSARTLPGYKVWQSFTTGVSGTLTEIDMGFFNDMSGDGQLQIFSGQGTHGSLLQTLTVPVIGITQTPVTWNTWMVNVPVEAGQQYTFCLIPNATTLPDPYGVAIGNPNPYGGGALGVDDPSGSYPTDFDTVFRTYVAPTPVP